MALQLPSRQPKIPRPTPTKLYIALSSFSTIQDGHPIVVQMGSRLRGDAPVVVRLPERFAEDGMSDLEVARTAAARRRPPDPVPQKPAKPVIPVKRRVLVVADFYMNNNRYFKGQPYDVDDAVVRAAPDMFIAAIPKE